MTVPLPFTLLPNIPPMGTTTLRRRLQRMMIGAQGLKIRQGIIVPAVSGINLGKDVVNLVRGGPAPHAGIRVDMLAAATGPVKDLASESRPIPGEEAFTIRCRPGHDVSFPYHSGGGGGVSEKSFSNRIRCFCQNPAAWFFGPRGGSPAGGLYTLHKLLPGPARQWSFRRGEDVLRRRFAGRFRQGARGGLSGPAHPRRL